LGSAIFKIAFWYPPFLVERLNRRVGSFYDPTFLFFIIKKIDLSPFFKHTNIYLGGHDGKYQ